MSYGMRRHVARGEQSDAATPEATAPANAYGSAIHHVIAATEDGHPDEEAIQQAWDLYGRWLEPTDLTLLREDLAVYRARDFPGTRTIAAEDEFRVPLFVHEGEQIYFRFKIDRLYERLDAEGTFIHVDYKSSKHPQSEAEVHANRQMWAYNWGICEYFPEVDTLIQTYDQLRYGQIPTRKSEPQRAEIKEWLIAEVLSILRDESVQGDGLLEPKFNQWCPWCPIMESCPVIGKLTDFSLARIAALQPDEAVLKQDRSLSKKVKAGTLDPARIDVYVTELEDAKRARQVLERFEGSVKDVLRDLPAERRGALGYELRGRTNSVFTAQAAAALHGSLGDRFYEVVKITKTGLEHNIVEDPDLLSWAIDLAEKADGTPAVVQTKGGAV